MSLIKRPFEKNKCKNCYYKFETDNLYCRKYNNVPCKEVGLCDDIHTQRFTYRQENQIGKLTENVIITPELRYKYHSDQDRIFKEVLRKLAYYEEMEERK